MLDVGLLSFVILGELHQKTFRTVYFVTPNIATIISGQLKSVALGVLHTLCRNIFPDDAGVLINSLFIFITNPFRLNSNSCIRSVLSFSLGIAA